MIRTMIIAATLAACFMSATLVMATVPEGPEGLAFFRLGDFIVFDKITAPKPLVFEKTFDFRTYHIACPYQQPDEEDGQFVYRQLKCRILSERPGS